ncbi:hypothetical protein [Dinoroseobacter sp. S76]|uniref:hypothetical protein n=1 Tax=Dinoroseobacter sp. S76 TaxID=3415124 RepID=UPI003C7AB630
MLMHKKEHTDQDLRDRRKRFLEAVHLQEMEGNPLDAEDIAIFEMFEREQWTDEQCIAFLNAKAQALATGQKAE